MDSLMKRLNLSGAAEKVLSAVLEKDRVSFMTSFSFRDLGLSQYIVSKAVEKLVDKNIIRLIGPYEYCFKPWFIQFYREYTAKKGQKDGRESAGSTGSNSTSTASVAQGRITLRTIQRMLREQKT